ncbi:MAG TPA: methionyl-tRNA formyltransferase [Planctomycetota bacterium]|nr:methionyl-tRNA formyltransferase [Planctomycetota bacterium]
MRIVFLGSHAFARESLDALLSAGFPPVLVVTPPPARRRRRGEPEPTVVHARAAEARSEVATPAKVNAPDSLARLRAAGADLFVVAQYGQILSEELLAIPRLGTINVHASLLPRHRGATPVAAAILAGDEETGVTIQRTVFRLDAGPILAARRVAIAPGEDAEALTARLARLGGELLVDVVRAFASGSAPAETSQDEGAATYCRKLKPGDARIDWARPAEEIARLVRALRPEPGARTSLRREPPIDLEVRRAVATAGKGAPGVVAAVARDGFDVGTGGDLLRVIELTPAAKRPMAARAFANGYRLAAGERFA